MTKTKAASIKVVETLLSLFKDENKQQFLFTKTQIKIIYAISLRPYPRIGLIAPTQYGKSTAIAIGIIIRAMLLPEKFVIVGGTKSKANIIMGYIIDHLFDDEIITSQIVIEGGALEKLRRERSRSHITFKRGGEIKTISAEYINTKKKGESLLGEGAKNIILDDSVLCSDEVYAYVKRMVGGKKDNFILEASNPLRRNHFYKTMKTDKLYHKIWIDYKEALSEGRFTPGYIAEMKKEKLFDVFYECKFPGAGSVDDEGYMPLLSEQEVEDAVGPVEINTKAEGVRLGVDVAQGGNNTVFVLRDNKKAIVDKSLKTPDLMEVPGIVIEYMRDKNIAAPFVFIDGTGIGSGAAARLKEQHYNINNVVWGSAASDDSKERSKDSKVPPYLNLRAECYCLLREWIQHGGRINNNENLINQLKGIKYRVNSSGKIQIQPKGEMLLSGDSPDEADALAETFAKNDIFKITNDSLANNSAFEDAGISAGDLENFTMSNFEKGR
jgi:hypothetical protein